MTDVLTGFTEADLLGQLPRPVRESIAALETDKAKWEDVGAALASGPTSGISLKGGGRWSGALWQNVKKEFHSFLCSDSSTYADLRKEWDSLRQKSSALAIASLSGLIGSQLGVASGVVAPLVIWAAVVALRIGKEAACAAMAPPPQPPA
jgi:hypothetical protein